MAENNDELRKAVAEAHKQRGGNFDPLIMIDKLSGKTASDPMYSKVIDLYVKIGGGQFGTTQAEIIKNIDEAVKRNIEARKKDGVAMTTFKSAVKYVTDGIIGSLCKEIASNPRTEDVVQYDTNYPELLPPEFFRFTEQLKMDYGGYLFTGPVVRNDYNSKPRTPEFVLFDPKGGPVNSKWNKLVEKGRIPASASARTKTAWCDPNCLMAYNTEFVLGIMVQAYLTGTNATGAIRGKKYKCNGGSTPDYYWPLEYLIIHELLHFRQGDFYIGDLMAKELDKLGKPQKMLDAVTKKPIMVPFSKAPFGSKVLNIANDLINNWIICEKYGLPPLTDGYTSEEITKEKMVALAKERGEHWIVTTFKIVMGDLRELHKNDKEEAKDEMQKGDQHQKSQDKSNDQGEQGEPQDGEPQDGEDGQDGESQDGDGQDGEGDADGQDGQDGESQDGDGSGEGEGDDSKEKQKGKGKGKGKPSDEPISEEEMDELNETASEANEANGDAPTGTKDDDGKEQSKDQKDKLDENKKKIKDSLEKQKDKTNKTNQKSPDKSGEKGEEGEGDEQGEGDKSGDKGESDEQGDSGEQGDEQGDTSPNGGQGDSVGNDKGEGDGEDFDPSNADGNANGSDPESEQATRDEFDKASEESDNPFDVIDKAFDDTERMIDEELKSERAERNPEEAREMEKRKEEADRQARNAIGKTLEDKLAAIKATAKMSWSQMLKNFFKTNMIQQESYARMSAQTIVNITSAVGDDGVAIDPGMVKETKKNKVRAVFCFDVSGSVHGDIGKANSNLWKLIKTFGTQFEECWFLRFSSAMDFDIHILSDGKLFKGKKLTASGRMKVIAARNTGKFMLDDKDIFPRERPFITILKGEQGVETGSATDRELSAIPGGGGTDFNATILNILESFYRRGCGIIFFTDSDCAHEPNLTSFKHMVFDAFGAKKRPRSIGICLTKESDFQAMVRALKTDGQSDPVWDMTYFTSGAFEEPDYS